jgi:hypothetical protein
MSRAAIKKAFLERQRIARRDKNIVEQYRRTNTWTKNKKRYT